MYINIISRKESIDRLTDGINTLLRLNNDDFNNVIDRLKLGAGLRFYYSTDKCELPTSKLQIGLEKKYDINGNFISRGYYGDKKLSTSEIFSRLDEMRKDFLEDNEISSKIETLMNCKNLEAFKEAYAKKHHIDIKTLDKVFWIVSSKENSEKFIDYDNNKDLFSLDNKVVPKSVFLRHLVKIFMHKITQYDDLSLKDNFYVQTDEFTKNWDLIFQNEELERYSNLYYEFQAKEEPTDFIIRQSMEPEWNINENLHREVYDGMPNDLNLEEKAMYVYAKLCRLLRYDEQYFYKDRLEFDNYTSRFDKDKIESIDVNSKIVCFEFSRLFAKFINEFEGDIEAVIISKGFNAGHFLTGFYTDNVSVKLEAINAMQLGNNDFANAKYGLPLNGIDIVSDKKDLIKKALDKVLPLIFGKVNFIYDCLTEFYSVEKTEEPNNFEAKLFAFIQNLKEKGIDGNEAVQSFGVFEKFGFFGSNIKKVYLGTKKNNMEYQRKVLVKDNSNKTNKIYLFSTDTLDVEEVQKDDILAKLQKGEYVYERENFIVDRLEEREM